MTLASTRIARALGEEDAPAPAEEVEAIARGRIEHARVDLLLDHPYFAAALLAIPMRGTSEPSIPQALVTDGRRIVYRYDLVAALERPKIRLLMMHALSHVLLEHPQRGLHREWTLWTTACDIAVELLFAQLGIERSIDRGRLKRFDGLSAEGIYAVIQREGERSIPSGPPAEDGLLAPEEQEGQQQTSEREAFERAMAGAEPPTPMQFEGVQRDFRDAATERSASLVGDRPGSGNAEIDAAAKAQFRWKHLLARFMREPLDRDWSYMRPNRKHLWRGLYLPGPVEIEGGCFVLAIDTSGSMSDRQLSLVLGEIDAIRRSCACELTVLQFDATIHAKAEYSRTGDEDGGVGSTKVMRMFGRGGTDLRLPFNWAAKERRDGRRISALIVCTDGYGPLPDEAPAGLPVLFLLTRRHWKPSFGEHLVLDEFATG